jgi:hypothetical protein
MLPQTMEVTQKVMELQSGATQPLCGISNSVTRDENDALTQEAEEGTVLISILEYNSTGNIVASNVMQTTELYDLPPVTVTVLDFDSQVE